jgi:hypothetical protein
MRYSYGLQSEGDHTAILYDGDEVHQLGRRPAAYGLQEFADCKET